MKKPIKKAQGGTTTKETTKPAQKLRPGLVGPLPFGKKKYLKTRNPKSNFHVKNELYDVEIDTTGYADGRKIFNGMQTVTKKGKKPYSVRVQSNRDYITDAINKGTNKAKNGTWMQKASASIKKRGTAGKCTPITKPGCTGKAKTLAKTFKKIAKSNKKK